MLKVLLLSFFCLFYFGLNIRKEICKVHILGSATQLMLNERGTIKSLIIWIVENDMKKMNSALFSNLGSWLFMYF